MGQDAASAGMSGAGTGAAIGSAIAPGVGTLIGAGVGGLIGVGASIYGANKASDERAKMDAYLNGQQADNTAWYNNNYNSDYMQRADTQALMKNTRDALKQNNKVASNMAAVTGATPEAQAVAKEQSNKVLTDTASRVAATGQAWKDNIQNQYMNRKAQIGAQQYGNMEGNANSYEALMGNGIKQIGSTADSLSNSFLKSKPTAAQSVQTSTTAPIVDSSVDSPSNLNSDVEQPLLS